MATNVDIRGLAVERRPSSSAIPRKRRWLSRYLLPALILLGFTGVIAWAAQTGSFTDLFESVIEKLTDSL